MRTTAVLFSVILILRPGNLSADTPSWKPPDGKKLIQYGWDVPNTAYVRRHIQEMERRPTFVQPHDKLHHFSGLVIQVTKGREPCLGGTRDALGWKTFSKDRFQSKDYAHAIEDLKATQFEQFSDNFIQMVSMPGVDLFDPQWDAVAHNAGVLAKIAKEGGCVGLVFDPEQYGYQRIWTHQYRFKMAVEQPREQSKQECVAKAIERGQQFVGAINREFPDVKILCLYGPTRTGFAPAWQYDLLRPFIEGMCRAAATGTEIIDGYKQFPNYREESSFKNARQDTIKGSSRTKFTDKAAFDRVMRAGFCLQLDEPVLWRRKAFQTAIHYALSHTDEFVWVFSERVNWWAGPEHNGPAYDKWLQVYGERPDWQGQPIGKAAL